MKNTHFILLLACLALLNQTRGQQVSSSGSTEREVSSANAPLGGFVETLDPKKRLGSLSFFNPPGPDGVRGALIVNQPIRSDGTFTLTKALPLRFVVETVPDRCLPLKTLIVGEDTVVSELLASTAGVTESKTNLTLKLDKFLFNFSSNERFKGISREAQLSLGKFKIPGIMLREREGGITFGCPGNDSRETSK